MNDEIRYAEPVELLPAVTRITQNNPGLFTGPGTNTFLVGEDELFILEPGEDTDEHFECIVAAVARRTVVGLIPTHAHHDHWPMATRLAQHYGAPSYGFAATGGYSPDHLVADGQRLEAATVALTAVHTPGHSSDHTAYVLDEHYLFSGDIVMDWSTSIISPPDGDLNQYMASLDKLLASPYKAFFSAHGRTLTEPHERTLELKAHREERTRQALAVLESGPATIPEMVQIIYKDVDKKLHGAAARSLLAHLDALERTGEVERLDEGTDQADEEGLGSATYRRS